VALSTVREVATRRRRFTRAELLAFEGHHVDDLVGDGVRLLFVGINPGLWTAAVNTHFARPGNRFWPALHLAGMTSRRIDASDGLAEEDARELLARGIGITNLVDVATARADELTREQLRTGAERLRVRVRELRPKVVAMLGLTAYRQAFGEPSTAAGRQAPHLEGSVLWVLPNPSGLNAHETVTSLAVAYRAAAEAAGVDLLAIDRGVVP
jgi:double-stranded uracil-DNA glycosylase